MKNFYTYRSAIIPRRPVLRLPPIQPHTLDPAPGQLLLLDPRHALAFQMDQMRHVPCPHLPAHIIIILTRHAAAFLAGPSDGGDEVGRGEAARFAVEAAVEDQDLEARAAGAGDGGADALEDERGDDGGVEAA